MATIYRSDLAIEIAGSVTIPEDVRDALETNGMVHIDPVHGDVAFFGARLRWDPMYTSLETVMAFLASLPVEVFQYIRLGQDAGDIVIEGQFHSRTQTHSVYEDLAEAIDLYHVA